MQGGVLRESLITPFAFSRSIQFQTNNPNLLQMRHPPQRSRPQRSASAGSVFGGGRMLRQRPVEFGLQEAKRWCGNGVLWNQSAV